MMDMFEDNFRSLWFATNRNLKTEDDGYGERNLLEMRNREEFHLPPEFYLTPHLPALFEVLDIGCEIVLD